MKKLLIAALAGLASLTPADAQQAHSAPMPIHSATRARDVNGFALGTTVSEIRTRMQLTHVDGEVFRGNSNGVNYEFGVTPLGRVYRIESSQPLGRFNLDLTFTRNLTAKLERKYGPPESNQLPTGPISWSLIEPVTHSDGTVLPFRTMTVDASFSDDFGMHSLEIRMQDYRVLWADSERLNAKPRDEAIGKITF